MEMQRTNGWSSTVTITLPPAQDITTLSLRPNPMAAILRSMLESALFSDEAAKLNDWASRLLPLNFNSTGRQVGEENACIITSFMIEVLHPKMAMPQVSKKDGKTLVNFEDEIKEVLQSLLSGNVDVDGFIDDCKRRIDEEYIEKVKSEAYEAFIQEEKNLNSLYAGLIAYNLNPRVKMDALLDQINASQLFSPLDMRDWEEILRGLKFETRERAVQEKNARAICLFLHDMIRPVLLAAESAEKEQKLPDFEARIREILQLILPDADAFMLRFKRLLDAEIVLNAKFKMIHSSFTKQLNQLRLSGKDAHQTIQENCLVLKQHLRELIEMRKSMSEEIFNEVAALNKKVEQFLNSSNCTAQRISAVGERMKNEQQVFLQLMQECENILRRL